MLRPEQVLAGMWLVFGLSAVLGGYLVYTAGWPVLLIGLASILAAIAYSGGPLPFGYYGLGDLAVFIFFGPVAVCGTYFIQAKSIDQLVLWSSIPMGLLITAILVVNNLRDIGSDAAAGKRTFAVRIGPHGARIEFSLCLAAAYLVPPLMFLIDISPTWVMLTWLSLPLAIRLNREVWRVEGRPLNRSLASMGQLTLLYAVLFSLGLVIAAFAG